MIKRFFCFLSTILFFFLPINNISLAEEALEPLMVSDWEEVTNNDSWVWSVSFFSWDNDLKNLTYEGRHIIYPGQSYTIWRDSIKKFECNPDVGIWTKSLTIGSAGNGTNNTEGLTLVPGSQGMDDYHLNEYLIQHVGDCTPISYKKTGHDCYYWVSDWGIYTNSTSLPEYVSINAWNPFTEQLIWAGGRLVWPGDSYIYWKGSLKKIKWNTITEHWERVETVGGIGGQTVNTNGLLKISGSASMSDTQLHEYLMTLHGECFPARSNLGNNSCQFE